MKRTIILVMTVILFWGCASTYKPIQPPNLRYSNTEVGEEVSYSYRFDVLNEKGNRKYARKEARYSINVVSFKITNNTDQELDFNRDFKFYMGGREIYPLESYVVTSLIQQGVFEYLSYGLTTLWIETENSTTMIPIGIPIGIGNMIAAASANKKFESEFAFYNMVNKRIMPHETIYGLVAFRDIDYGRIDVKIGE